MSTPRNQRPEAPPNSAARQPAAPLVTARDLAAVLGVTTDTIRGWARTGRIPCLRVGQKTLRFDREAVLAAIRDGGAAEGGAA
ncbi:MAG: helix-turn-helix domain-containing protein [Phycisphaerae bacterium]|nr:helix-turn-helix domain-containing protein [Phycisphaerae bacterium]